MKIETGYLYHIKDEFFDIVNDDNLMTSHERGKRRPTYFTIKDGDILWFIPLSSKVDKYKKIIDKKIEKYGVCNTILIENVFDKKAVILLQNAFPTLEKYIQSRHTVDGKAIKIASAVEREIIDDFEYMLSLKTSGLDLFFTDIDFIKNLMLDELKVLN